MKQLLSFNNLVDKKFNIALGSSIVNTSWSKDILLGKLTDVIKHNFFDADFFYNWTNNREEYLNIFNENVLIPMITNIDETLRIYFKLKKTSYSTLEEVLIFRYNDSELWIDNWFQTNPTISKTLKSDYYIYREKYAGIYLK